MNSVDQAAQRAMYALFVRAATAITCAFGVITLTLGALYHDARRYEMSVLLFSYAAALVALRPTAGQSVERAAFLTAVVTLAGTVALAVLHPAIHSALVLAALFPAAVALHFARGRAQLALMALSWFAAVCVGVAAEYVTPSAARPRHGAASVPAALDRRGQRRVRDAAVDVRQTGSSIASTKRAPDRQRRPRPPRRSPPSTSGCRSRSPASAKRSSSSTRQVR